MKLLIISCAAVISSSKLGTLKGDGGTFYFPAQTTQKPVGEFQAWFHYFLVGLFSSVISSYYTSKVSANNVIEWHKWNHKSKSSYTNCKRSWLWAITTEFKFENDLYRWIQWRFGLYITVSSDTKWNWYGKSSLLVFKNSTRSNFNSTWLWMEGQLSRLWRYLHNHAKCHWWNYYHSRWHNNIIFQNFKPRPS